MTARLVKGNEMLHGVVDLLQSNGLPYKDISFEKSLMVSYQDDNGNIIGSGGLEFYGPYTLLRSIAVRKDLHGKAIGKAIVHDLIERAKSRKSTAIYLLTETAHDYFSRLQFHDVDRENVPSEIRSSSEFNSVCPETAACMVYRSR